MKQTAEKNKKQRTSYHPISIGLVLKTTFAVAGFALWGWSFVAVVVGIYLAFEVIRVVLSCLFSLLVVVAVVILLLVLIL